MITIREIVDKIADLLPLEHKFSEDKVHRYNSEEINHAVKSLLLAYKWEEAIGEEPIKVDSVDIDEGDYRTKVKRIIVAIDDLATIYGYIAFQQTDKANILKYTFLIQQLAEAKFLLEFEIERIILEQL